MGLLDRVLSDPEIDEDKLAIKDHKENFSTRFQQTRSLLTSYQNGGDELLKDSFNKICKLFDIQKGAFFLLDTASSFLKVNQIVGFDVTTSKRIRFSKDILEKLEINKSSQIDNEKFILFKQLLSSREYALLDDMFLSPVRYGNDGIIALFMITESAAFEMAGRLESSFEELNFILAPLLYTSFIKPTSPLKEKPDTLTFYQESNNEIIDQIENRYKNEDIVLVITDYSSLINLDLQNGLSILKLLNSITGERVSTFDLGSSKAMMVYPGSLFPDKELFEQQLKISFERVLNQNDPLPEYIIKYYTYKHESDSSLKEFIVNATSSD